MRTDRQTDRQTGRQTDRSSIAETDTQFNKLISHVKRDTSKSAPHRRILPTKNTRPRFCIVKKKCIALIYVRIYCTWFLVPGIFFVSAVGGKSVRFIFCFVLTCHQRQSGLNKSGVWPSPATYSITEPHRSNSYCKNTENLRAFLGTPLRLPDNILRESDTPGFHGTIGKGSGHRGNPWDRHPTTTGLHRGTPQDGIQPRRELNLREKSLGKP